MLKTLLVCSLATFISLSAAHAEFKTRAEYMGPNQLVIGKELTHVESGTKVHLLRLETVPQAMIWINTPVLASRGEPHVCEHLLLSKGSKGKAFSELGEMVLGESSASTYNQFTNYHLSSAAGLLEFEKLLRSQLEALLRPDFTTTAVRREAYQFAVQKSEDGVLSLTEKGTIYNEMLDNEGQGDSYYGVFQLIYGKESSLGKVSGGEAPEIRKLRGHHMWEFHKRRYRLGEGTNMIIVLPPNESEDAFLARLNEQFQSLDRWRKHQRAEPHVTAVAQPDPDRSVRIFQRPSADANASSTVFLAWVPKLKYDSLKELKQSTFLEAFASGSKSVLHKSLVDRETRAWNSGIVSTEGGLAKESGEAVPLMTLQNLTPEYVTVDNLEKARQHIVDKLREFSQLPDGDPRITEFNELVAASLSAIERSLNKTLVSPPGFGQRSANSFWIDVINEAALKPGFKKDLTPTPEIAALREELKSGKNIWREVILENGLLETPYVSASRPNQKRLDDIKLATQKRIAAKLKQLQRRYKTSDPQLALAEFEKDYNKETERMLAGEKQIVTPRFVSNPPLGRDPDLKLEEKDLAGVPVLTTAFTTTPKQIFKIEFAAEHVAVNELVYIAMLPTFITQTGLNVDGVRQSFKDVDRLISQTMLGVDVDFISVGRQKKMMLKVSGSGANAAELQNSQRLVLRQLEHSDISVENLPRLRELVERKLVRYKELFLGAEENWTGNPSSAYSHRGNSTYVHANSWFSQMHDMHRLKWRLKGGKYSAEEIAQAQEFLDQLKKSGYETALKSARGTLVAEMISDLQSREVEVLPANWNGEAAYLVELYLQELQYGVDRAIADLKSLRAKFIGRNLARGLLVTDKIGYEKALADFAESLSLLPATAPADPEVVQPAFDTVDANLRRRKMNLPSAAPHYIGLVNEQSRNGNIIIGTKCNLAADQLNDETLMTVLGMKILGGSGGHGFFMQTWQEGLAYSNGANANVLSGDIGYYAERCPSIRETMAFVKKIANSIDTVQLEHMGDYVLANTFQTRIDQQQTARAVAMAAEMRDGLGPEAQKLIFQRLLDLKEQPNFEANLRQAGRRGLSAVFVNWGDNSMKEKMNTNFFFIAPESQLADMEKELGGPKLIRLQGSDFWDRR